LSAAAFAQASAADEALSLEQATDLALAVLADVEPLDSAASD
jgi:hypothetical protein